MWLGKCILDRGKSANPLESTRKTARRGLNVVYRAETQIPFSDNPVYQDLSELVRKYGRPKRSENPMDGKHNRLIASMGRLLYVATFRGHEFFPFIFVKYVIR